MIIRICRGQPELAVRVVAPGCDGGQLVDYEDMELCILAPKCTCEGPFSKLYFKGCGWWGHDVDRWNDQQVPPEEMPVLVYPAFDTDDDGNIVFTADSDALITKGIIALLIQVLSGHTPKEIAEADLYFIDRIGLKDHLSPTRSNGLLSMVKQIRMYALAYEAKEEEGKAEGTKAEEAKEGAPHA